MEQLELVGCMSLELCVVLNTDCKRLEKEK